MYFFIDNDSLEEGKITVVNTTHLPNVIHYRMPLM